MESCGGGILKCYSTNKMRIEINKVYECLISWCGVVGVVVGVVVGGGVGVVVVVVGVVVVVDVDVVAVAGVVVGAVVRMMFGGVFVAFGLFCLSC